MSPDPALLDLGGGFTLTATAADRWHLDTPFAPPGWVARRRGDAAHSPFPGTALRRGEVWWEIVDIQPRPSGPPAGMRYALAPWPAAEVFRSTADLTPEACAALVQAERQRVQRHRRARCLTLWTPVVGLLPGDDQARLETSHGVTATRITVVSALTVLPLAAVAAGIGFAASRGLYFGTWQPLARQLAPWWPLFVYLALESVVRLRVATSADMPCGSALVAMPIVMARTMIGALANPFSSTPVVRPASAGDPVWRHARDAITRRSDGRVEIRSRLPKPHWTLGVTGIAFEGQVHAMIERDVVETAKGLRHRFLLEPLPPDRSPSIHVTYHPDEVQDLLREGQRVKTAMWIESVPFLWGLQGEQLQRDLARVYRYDPLRWTRFTLAATGLIGIVNLIAPWQRASNGLIEMLVLATGVLLVWETMLRARDFQRGTLRPSLLGRPFAGIARRSLRWAPRRGSLVDDQARAEAKASARVVE